MGTLLASAPTGTKIIKLISKFYYSNNITLKKVSDTNHEVHNLKGVIRGVRVVQKKNRFRFEKIDYPMK